MRIEIINGQRVEYADEGKWLYNDLNESERYFTTYVYLGSGIEPWTECTDMARLDYEAWWERQHPQPEPVEPEPEDNNG